MSPSNNTSMTRLTVKRCWWGRYDAVSVEMCFYLVYLLTYKYNLMCFRSYSATASSTLQQYVLSPHVCVLVVIKSLLVCSSDLKNFKSKKRRRKRKTPDSRTRDPNPTYWQCQCLIYLTDLFLLLILKVNIMFKNHVLNKYSKYAEKQHKC